MNILFILNEAPYGSEKTYNPLRLAMATPLVEGTKMSTMSDLAPWTIEADKVLVFQDMHTDNRCRRQAWLLCSRLATGGGDAGATVIMGAWQ